MEKTKRYNPSKAFITWSKGSWPICCINSSTGVFRLNVPLSEIPIDWSRSTLTESTSNAPANRPAVTKICGGVRLKDGGSSGLSELPPFLPSLLLALLPKPKLAMAFSILVRSSAENTTPSPLLLRHRQQIFSELSVLFYVKANDKKNKQGSCDDQQNVVLHRCLLRHSHHRLSMEMGNYFIIFTLFLSGYMHIACLEEKAGQCLSFWWMYSHNPEKTLSNITKGTPHGGLPCSSS